MQIDVVAVGRLGERFYRDAVDEYARRLSRYCRLTLTEVPDLPAPASLSERMAERIRRQECDALREKVPQGAVTVALDRRGTAMTSEEFAAFLGIHEMAGKRMAFLIGGSLGFPAEFTAHAAHCVSFGAMTYPHQLMRVILLEQIYRGFRIIRGEPYHK
ncbi:MAG: 23S rRNA (pseudouridine(1915)-N(3))-methyltransferase RlmH [Christensenellales bacterium]|jgi:23S rRNA (pseudouridine1915-N3)-methyltransferase